jgi:hypothetical protein
LRHLYIKTIILPRQARDKHRENSKKSDVFRREIATGRVPPRDGAADEFTVADVVRQEYSFHRFYTDCRCIPPESYPENPSGIEALDVLTLGVFVLETTWMERRERPSAAQALTLLVGSEDESHVNHAAANAQGSWTPDLLEVPAPGNIY